MFRYTSDLRKQLISQGWVDASKEELPIVEEIRKLLINSTGTSTIKKELEKKGWKYEHFASFLSRFTKQRKLFFYAPDNTDIEEGLLLEIVMKGNSASYYYIMRWMEEWYDPKTGKIETNSPRP